MNFLSVVFEIFVWESTSSLSTFTSESTSTGVSKVSQKFMRDSER